MSTYEFRCQKCGERFAARMSWQDKDKAACPACGSSKLQQLFTGINILGGGISNKCSPPAGSRFS